MRKYLISFILFLSASPLWSQADSTVQKALNDTAKTVKADTTNTFLVEINKLLRVAESNLGTPYRYAGKQPGGFDCSGFVMYCYKTACGIPLSPSATSYYMHGTAVSKAQARPGDVICFTGSNAYNRSIGHVGIITEVTPTEIYFIHSALNGGVRHDSLSLGYYKTRFLGIRRILR
ncbi:MAG: C40 family peptidase [Bacteroidetes bacterium]|nr:C40 family peptidase [Bacteroidota bacterium]